jgi:hypothetical protein
LIDALRSLYEDQDHTTLRFRRPSKFIFLCGGVITHSTYPENLRDYLYRTKNFANKLNADIVLAETARDLYRATQYKDLISFEEDIARIASLVLVIPESPGSLAELGAFAANDIIRRALRVIMQQRFENDESFIRFGPIELLIKRHGRDFVGFYPWRVDATRRIRAISQHFKAVVEFINDHLDRIPASTAYQIAGLEVFYIIYWVTNILMAVSSSVLRDCVLSLLPDAHADDIVNKLYCLVIAGWLKKIGYSHKDYYYATVDMDPFDYSYKPGVRVRDSLRPGIFDGLRHYLAAPEASQPVEWVSV